MKALYKITEKTTLKDIYNICTAHLGQSKDCESCPIYTFCIRNFNEYPSGWKLEVTPCLEVEKV